MPQRILLSHAQEGMVLDKPVTNANGLVLVGEGVTLSASLILRLQKAGATYIYAKGAPSSGVACGPSLEHVSERLDYLFRKFKDDQFMWTLRNFIGEYFAKCLKNNTREEAGNLEKQADV